MAVLHYMAERGGFLVYEKGVATAVATQSIKQGSEGLFQVTGQRVLVRQNLPARLVVDGVARPESGYITNLPDRNEFFANNVPLLLDGGRLDLSSMGFYLWLTSQ